MQARLTMSTTASGYEQLRIRFTQPAYGVSRGMILLAFDSLFSGIDARHRVNFTFSYEEVVPRQGRVHWDAETHKFLAGCTAVPQRFFQLEGNAELLFCLTKSLYACDTDDTTWYLQPCCEPAMLQDVVNGLPGVVVRRRAVVVDEPDDDPDDDDDTHVNSNRGGRLLTLGNYDDD